MAERKTIVCLANSRKLGAYCVAGVEQGSLTWVRPIGSGTEGAVTWAEQTLDTGAQPRLLDVIELPLLAPTPEPAQPENWTLAPGQWVLRNQLDEESARDLLERLVTDEAVFGTHERSITVEQAQAEGVTASLAAIRPEGLTFSKQVWPGEGMKIRANFRHAGAWYDLRVTDLDWCSTFVDDDVGSYELDESEEAFLVISLTEPFNGEHWKLVAGVVVLRR